MAYDLNFKEEAMMKFHIKRFFLYPKFWTLASNKLHMTLNWKSVEFRIANLASVPSKKGVYAFTVKPEYSGLFETNYLFYIGKTNRTLRERFKEYVDDQNGKGKPRKKVFGMLKQYKKYLHFYFAEVASTGSVNVVEDKLINTLVPPVNVAVTLAKIKPELQYLYE